MPSLQNTIKLFYDTRPFGRVLFASRAFGLSRASRIGERRGCRGRQPPLVKGGLPCRGGLCVPCGYVPARREGLTVASQHPSEGEASPGPHIIPIRLPKRDTTTIHYSLFPIRGGLLRETIAEDRIEKGRECSHSVGTLFPLIRHIRSGLRIALDPRPLKAKT